MATLIKNTGNKDSGTREYLTFRLGEEEYGIDILKVQEIRGYEEPTRIANAPDFIRGVVNLRGTIVPIVDMRRKLNCAKEPLHKSPTHVLAHACRVRQHPGLCSNLILA